VYMEKILDRGSTPLISTINKKPRCSLNATL
jgi:hypothetical protein